MTEELARIDLHRVAMSRLGFDPDRIPVGICGDWPEARRPGVLIVFSYNGHVCIAWGEGTDGEGAKEGKGIVMAMTREQACELASDLTRLAFCHRPEVDAGD